MCSTEAYPRTLVYNLEDEFAAFERRLLGLPGGTCELHSTGIYPKPLDYISDNELGTHHEPLRIPPAGFPNVRPERTSFSSGQASLNSPTSPPTSESIPAELRFLRQLKLDFPNGFQLIPTDGSHLLCGLRALQHSTRAQMSHLIRVPSVTELWHIATAIGNDQNNFRLDHLAATLQEYGKMEGRSLQLGCVVDYQGPIIFGGNLDTDCTPVHTLWIHNNNAEYALGAGYSHYSGVRAKAINPQEFRRDQAFQESHRRFMLR